MGQPKERPYFTVDQYLALERRARNRHEFLDGEIFAMAGESWDHGTISSNVAYVMLSQLKNKPCQAQAKDMKALAALAEPLDASCTMCHKHFRPNVFPRDGGSK